MPVKIKAENYCNNTYFNSYKSYNYHWWKYYFEIQLCFI